MKVLIGIFNFIIFPGFIFSALIGLIAGWVDRKVSARIHYRVGPPWHQNFTDIVKLLGKEVIVPQKKLFFLLSPVLVVVSSSLAAGIIGRDIISSSNSFNVDLIIVLYLLSIPAISMIISAAKSGSPLAVVGASREMRMVFAYELPFVLSLAVVIIRSSGSLQLGNILEYQLFSGSNIASLSGALAFFVSIFCMQAKLGFVPFDASEAEQELAAGILVEYSGLPLAVYKLAKAVLLYTVPLFLIVLFMGKDLSPLFISLKYIGILVIMILIKNTNPRLRIDQAERFFRRIPTALAVIAVILALTGL